MKSSVPKQISSNSAKSPQATVSAVRFRPQPLPCERRVSVGRSVVNGARRRWFFIRWPDRVWARKLELAHRMVDDVRAHIAGLDHVEASEQ
jgi:hypothetical protein